MRLVSLFLSLSLLPASAAQAALYISIIQGLGGQPEYQTQFDEQREQVLAASRSITDADKVTTLHGDDATREQVLAHFARLNAQMGADDRAAIYLIGHGSFDGTEYKFNIPGPDLTASDLKDILEKLPGRNHFLVNTSSTSGATLDNLIEKDADAAYILITATRNGNERNATHFGRFFAEALTNESADLNKNNSISIQEAFDYAERSVNSYFEEAGRLATEHAQLRGEGAAQFNLARVSEVQITADDPELNDLLQQRLAVDTRIEELQLRRGEMSNNEYIERLQALVLESAALSERIEAMRQGAPGGNN